MKLIDPSKGLIEKDAKEIRKNTPGWMRPKTKTARDELRDERKSTWEAKNNAVLADSGKSKPIG